MVEVMSEPKVAWQATSRVYNGTSQESTIALSRGLFHKRDQNELHGHDQAQDRRDTCHSGSWPHMANLTRPRGKRRSTMPTQRQRC